MKRLVITMLWCLPFVATAQYKSQVWCPDNGDGTYTNPVTMRIIRILMSVSERVARTII